MIWPHSGKADFIDLEVLKNKEGDYPYIIHWAGMKYRNITELPRADIISFFRDYFYLRDRSSSRLIDQIEYYLLIKGKMVKLILKKAFKVFYSR